MWNCSPKNNREISDGCSVGNFCIDGKYNSAVTRENMKLNICVKCRKKKNSCERRFKSLCFCIFNVIIMLLHNVELYGGMGDESYIVN